MRGDPDQHGELDAERGGCYDDLSVSRGKPHTSYHHHSNGGAGGQSDTYLFRKSPLTIRTQTPPRSSDSPPAVVRHPPTSGGGGSPPPTSTNSTPLLTASLNAAPIVYYNNLRAKSDVPSNLSTAKPQTTSSGGAAKPKTSSSGKPEDAKPMPDASHCLSNSQSAFYSSLIHQLRQKTGGGGGGGDNNKHSLQIQWVKIRKERSKPLPFTCPACKKRFQRHIALNAHFQNEHISLPCPSSGERSCKLCGGMKGTLAAVRNHLRLSHNIDLDNPTKCLEEQNHPATGGKVALSPSTAASVAVASKYSVLEASLRSGGGGVPASYHHPAEEAEPSCSNIEMYESGQSSPQSVSPSPAHTPTSSESPERSLFPIKQEHHQHHPHQGYIKMATDEEDPQVEDLSIRKPAAPISPPLSLSSSRRYSPAPPPLQTAARSPRPDSPCAKLSSKRFRMRESSPSPTAAIGGAGHQEPPAATSSGYTCGHCNIVYPNQTLYFLHRGFHSESNPWRCNSCGHVSTDLYDFNTHLFSVAHQ